MALSSFYDKWGIKIAKLLLEVYLEINVICALFFLTLFVANRVHGTIMTQIKEDVLISCIVDLETTIISLQSKIVKVFAQNVRSVLRFHAKKLLDHSE